MSTFKGRRKGTKKDRRSILMSISSIPYMLIYELYYMSISQKVRKNKENQTRKNLDYSVMAD